MKSKLGSVLFMALYCTSALADGGRELHDDSPLCDLVTGIKNGEYRVTLDQPIRLEPTGNFNDMVFYEIKLATDGSKSCKLKLTFRAQSDTLESIELPAGLAITGGPSVGYASGDGWGNVNRPVISRLPEELARQLVDSRLRCIGFESVGQIREAMRGTATIQSEASVAQAVRNALAARDQFLRNTQDQVNEAHRQASQINRKPAVLEPEDPHGAWVERSSYGSGR